MCVEWILEGIRIKDGEGCWEVSVVKPVSGDGGDGMKRNDSKTSPEGRESTGLGGNQGQKQCTRISY